jgi:hypothetical protein
MSICVRVLVKAFNDLGYVEGKNIHLEHRFPAENPAPILSRHCELCTGAMYASSRVRYFFATLSTMCRHFAVARI